jgi:hypothetical protein
MELLSAKRAFTFADLYAMLGNEDTVAWLTPHTAVIRRHGKAVHAWNQLDVSRRFRFSADGKHIFVVALSSEHGLELCDFVLRLLAASVVYSLSLSYYGVSNGAWGAICDSLKAHPTLEVLNISATWWYSTTTTAVIKFRIQALVDMMKVTMSLHTIYLDSRYTQHELFRDSVIPYLETNRLRPNLLAIQRTRPIPYRAKVLGRALLAVRTDPNRFWILLSGNAEVAFPSGTSIAAAATAAANTSTAK